MLDNYGYHYAVMPREERQRKLYNQYYFHCGCVPCSSNWSTYNSLPQAAVPLAGTSPEQVMRRLTISLLESFFIPLKGEAIFTAFSDKIS